MVSVPSRFFEHSNENGGWSKLLTLLRMVPTPVPCEMRREEELTRFPAFQGAEVLKFPPTVRKTGKNKAGTQCIRDI